MTQICRFLRIFVEVVATVAAVTCLAILAILQTKSLWRPLAVLETRLYGNPMLSPNPTNDFFPGIRTHYVYSLVTDEDSDEFIIPLCFMNLTDATESQRRELIDRVTEDGNALQKLHDPIRVNTPEEESKALDELAERLNS